MVSSIKAVIFDCFGVVVGKGFNETYRLAGGDPVADRAFINDVLLRSNLGLIAESQFRQEVAAHLRISLGDWQAATEAAELPDVELLNYIAGLRQKFKTAVLSNANTGVLPRRIGPEWLAKCFDAVIVSAEIGKVKPDPEIYLYTAAKLGVQPTECVFFDDHIRYAEAAEKTGMHGIKYENLDQARAALETLIAKS
jgi:putative hydrolase of the HAD superfamily